MRGAAPDRRTPACGASTIASALPYNDPDRPQPLLDELWPFGDGVLRASQPEGMPAVGVQVHLDRNACVLQRVVVHQRVIDTVDAIGFSMKQERRRRVALDLDVRVERVWAALGHPQVTWIQRHCEIRTAADLVGIVDDSVTTALELRADRRHEMS